MFLIETSPSPKLEDENIKSDTIELFKVKFTDFISYGISSQN